MSSDSDGFVATNVTAGVMLAAAVAGGAGGPPPLRFAEHGASSDAGRETAAKAEGEEGPPADVVGEGGE